MVNSCKSGLIICLAALCLACDAGQSETELLQQSQTYLNERKLDSAAIQLRNVLQQNPESMQARLLLGQVYLAQEDLPSAVKELLAAAELGSAPADYLPDLARAYLWQGKNPDLQALPVNGVVEPQARGLVLASQGLGSLYDGDSGMALVQIDEALSLNPESLYVQVAKARLSAGTLEEDFAREEIAAVLEKDPDYAPAWSLLGDIERYAQNPEAAETAFSRAISQPDHRWQDLLKRAQIRVQMANLEGAQQDMDALKKRIPNTPDVNYTQGLIYLGTESLAEASQSFNQVLSVDERNLNALYYSALTNMRLGNVDIAIKHAENFYSLAPDSPLARKLLASIRLAAGQASLATTLLAPIAGVDSNDLDALSMMSEALLRQGLTQEAIPVLRRLVQLQPDSLQARSRLATALLESGNDAEGIALLNAIIDNDPASESTYQLLAAHYLRRENQEEALKVAQRLQAAVPDSVVALQLIANIQIVSGDQSAAIATLEQIETRVPGDLAANFSLAELAIAEKNYSKARNYYERILDRAPDDLTTLLRLARLDALEERPEELEATLQRAMSAHPSALEPRLMLARYFLATGRRDESLPLLRSLNSLENNRPEVLELLALVQLADGNYDDARSTLDNLATQLPNSASAQYMLARAYAGLNNQKATLRHLGNAAQLDPENPGIGFSFARALITTKNLEQAAVELDRLDKLSPGNESVLRLRALVAHQQGNKEQSAALLGDIFESDPSTTNLLAVVGQLWDQGDREAALAMQEQWLYENPGDMAAAQALAGAYAIEGKTSDALAGFEKLLEKDPDNIVVLNELAWLLRQDQPEKALGFAERANTLQPRSPALMDTLAVALYYAKQYAKAREVIGEALLLAPKHPSLRYHEAMIDAALGDTGKSVRTLESILSEGTDFSEKGDARELLAKLQSE